MQAAQAQHGQLRSFHLRHLCPLYPGMCVHGLGLDGGTGPGCRDWRNRPFPSAHCSPPCKGLTASTCPILQSEKTRKLNSIMKKLFLQVNPIFQTRNGTFLFYMYCFSSSGSFLEGVREGDRKLICSPWWRFTSGIVVLWERWFN